MNNRGIAAIPFLGSGLGYRRELRGQILESRDAIDFLEIITDQFIEDRRTMTELEELCDTFPVIPHGVGLSVGSISPPDMGYLRAVKRVSDVTHSPYYSEHVCMTRSPGIDIGHLAPVWFTERVLRATIDNVGRVQDFLGKPLVLENVTYLFDVPGGSMSQAEFFTRLVEATDCGILLDVTNVHINSVNHGFDAIAFLEAMPLDRVVQTHLAGGYWMDGVLVDGHSEPVSEDSWRLLEALTRRATIKGNIIEHDGNFPEHISALLDQVSRSRSLVFGANGSGGVLD